VGESSWGSLSEMDLRFARSRRRAAARRSEPPRRSPAAWRSVRAGLLTLVLLTVVAESTRLESSNATSPTRTAAAPTLDPACPVPPRFRAAFASAATKTGVPLSLLVATAYEESRMDPAARSHAGARGLLQVMPETARALRLGGDDPAANVLAGARYLRQLLDRFGGAAPTLGTLRYVKNIETRTGQLLACAG
jgi:soluble lytic murein transglycosylase-like protein